MCGRYAFFNFEVLAAILKPLNPNITFPPDALAPTWNAAPTQILPVLVETEDEESWELRPMSWGLIPRWTRAGEKPKVTPINARSETLTKKAMFRSLVKQRRCVVPANGFYEWQTTNQGKSKQPYFIHPTHNPLMLFAGLYDEARDEDGKAFGSYTIITTSANEKMSKLHDRMPVILPEDDIDHWLSHSETDFEPLEYLMQPVPDDAIDFYPVNNAVGSPRNNTPDLLEPLEGQAGLFNIDPEAD